MMNKTNSEGQQGSQQQLPKTYLDLIDKVGGKGKYQYIFVIIQAFATYIDGIILMSTAFIFKNPDFDCPAFGLLVDDCYATVCSLPSDQWAKFVTTQANSFRSLANSFGSYYCDDQVYLNIYSSAPYFGTLIGGFFITILADNVGRRPALLTGSWLAVVGVLLLIFAQQLWMASLGLVLCGMGIDSLYGTFLALIAESVDDNFRQKAAAITQGFFVVGALFVTLFYYLYEDWQISTIYCVGIPTLICALTITFYIKQSPMYLAIQGSEKLLNEINDIGWINKKERNILKMQDVENVIKHQQTIKYNKASNPIDVFRYPSLRTLTIASGIISIATSTMYYGPSLIVDKLGFDIYISQTVINIADLMTYYPLMLIIDKVSRKTCNSILFAIATMVSIALIFIEKPSNCDMCAVIFIQLGLVFVLRFVVSMEFAFMLIYRTQLYPIRVRNVADGVLSVFSAVSSTVNPIIMGAFKRAQLSPFILFTVLGIIAIGAYLFCPETLGKLCPEEIQEIEYQKMQNSKRKSGIEGDKLHQY